MTTEHDPHGAVERIAIIGMSGRFPAATNTSELWENLKNGVDGISFFDEAELAASGVDVSSIANDSSYVRARGIIEDADQFDARFFGINPREVQVMDPQHRILLEESWMALEDAGHDPEQFDGLIGIYAGQAKNTYLKNNLYPNLGLIEAVSGLVTELGNIPDYLTTRISYKLNLRGPSVTVHTACSTSLVAIYHACQSLLNYQCDMALAGGVTVLLPQKIGHWSTEGDISSPDGYTRSFDAKGQGTVFSNGAGVLVLRRLKEAIEDGDRIIAVISGIAINNDGSAKAGFGAPSVEGQSEVIAMAQAMAGVDPREISYVECHGTATPLGDPIEIAALTRAFRAGTDEKGFCAIGSAKSNFGHLDAAAGVTGVIKTALALHHGQIPPTLHFEQPNPKFDIEETPFFVNDSLRSWESSGAPRVAGVSSFGVGGTNAHAILEEAPAAVKSGPSRPLQLLVVSGKTESAADEACRRLADHLAGPGSGKEEDLADVAFTLQLGRQGFDHRRFLVCEDVSDAVGKLRGAAPGLQRGRRKRRDLPVVYLLPGQGAQYPNMGRALYETEPVFRKHIDACAEALRPHMELDLRSILYPEDDGQEESARLLRETTITQPALFVVEYSLAQLWMQWGVHPTKMVGHSIGEFVAACLAGVLTAEEALRLLACRGRLMNALPPGGMMAVPMSEEDLLPILPDDLSIAAINSPLSCVVSGPHGSLQEFEAQLNGQDISARQLHTSHAFHSSMMDPVIEVFASEVAKVDLKAPKIPFTSSVTGDWISDAQATDPAYWASHLRRAVRFADARQKIADEGDAVLLEVGPGSTLSALANHRAYKAAKQRAVSSLGHVLAEKSELECVLEALGSLWLEGAPVDWKSFWKAERRSRLALPGYPFERKSYWIDPPAVLHDRTPVPLAAPSPLMTTAEHAEGNLAESPMPAPEETPAVETTRQDAILTFISEVMQDLGGLDPEDVDPHETFLDLGFDSLFLTQAGLALKKKFGLKITLRQLLEEAPTPDDLSRYIDSKLPADAFQPAPPTPAATAPRPALPEMPLPGPASVPTATLSPGAPSLPVAPSSGHASSFLEQTVQQQLALMATQLKLLAGRAASQPSSEPVHSSLGQPPQAQSRQTAMTSEPRVEAVAAPVPLDVALPDNREVVDADPSARFGPWKPINAEDVDGLNERRTAAVNDLVRRYTARTPGSKALTEKNRGHLADPRAVSGFRSTWKELVYPIAAVRSSGSRIWDVDGNEYIDLRSGFGSVFFGHSPEFVTVAVEAQLQQGVQIGPTSAQVGELAHAICNLTGMDRVTFCNTGSEAVMAAMRVARTVTGRDKIALFSHDYHGIFDEVLVRGSGRGDPPPSRPVSPGIPASAVEHVVVLEYGEAKSLEWLQQHAHELAAVLIEPVQSRHPDLQPREFLHSLREITRKAETALIFDEVITGFRLHPGGAQAWYGIEADLATYGKIIGGGMPMGVVAGRVAFMDALDGGQWKFGDDSFPEVGVTYFAGTFQRHPLAIAAGLAVTRHLEQEGPALQERVGEKCRLFVDHLNDHFKRVGAPIHIERCESMFSFQFLEDHEFTSLFYYYMREKCINIWEGGASFLTAAHSDEDLRAVVRVVKQVVAEMQDAGFLAGQTPESLLEQSDDAGEWSSRRLPITEAQREIWLACQMGEDANCAYNESDTLELSGLLDVETLRTAVWQVLRRHEALHVTFDDLGTYQELQEPTQIDIPLHDLSDVDSDEQAARVEELVVKVIATDPFDLDEGPLVRSLIVRLAEDRHLFLLGAHHIVVDGWAAGVLLDEIGSVYSALRRNETPSLPPALHFADYVREEERAASAPEMQDEMQYWTKRLTPHPPALDLPLDRARLDAKSYRGGTIKRELRASVYEAARQVAAKHKTTMFVTLLAPYQVLLYRLSGAGDIVVGMPTAGQAISGMDTLVGHCVNLLPLRSTFSGDETVSDRVSELRGTVLDAYEHQQCTFGSILRSLSIERVPGRLPLVEVIFNLNRDRALLEFEGLDVRFHENPRRAVNFDLFFNIYEGASGLTVDLDYNADLFDAETVERWITHYECLLEGMAANPDDSLDDLPMMSAEDTDVMVSGWRATSTK